MGLVLGVLLALVPLAITPNLHLFFDVTPKVTLILVGAAAAALLSLRDYSRFRAVLHDGGGRRFYLLLALAFLWACAVTLLSTDRFLSVSGTNWRRFGLPEHVALLALAAACAAWLAGPEERAPGLLRVMSLTGLVASLYGILQYFGWDPWLSRAAYQAGEGEWTIVRPPSTFGHAGCFATWLLFPVFSSAGMRRLEKSRFWRAAAGLCVISGTLAIVLSGTRAALLALVAGAAALLVWTGVEVSRRVVVLTLAAAVAAAFFYVSPAGELLRRRVHWIGEDVRGGARILLWAGTVRMAAANPVTGYGLESFSKAFPRFQPAALARRYPDFYHESPHNLLLDALAQAGVPGLAILLGLIAVALAAGVRAADRDPRAKALTVALGACLLSLQFTPAVPAVCLYAAVIAAMLVSRSLAPEVALAAPAVRRGAALPGRRRASARRPGEEPGWLRARPHLRVVPSTSVVVAAEPPAMSRRRRRPATAQTQARWTFLASGAILAVTLSAFGARTWIADAFLRDTANALDRQNVTSAPRFFEKAVAWGANADVWYSRRMLQIEQTASAPAVRIAAWQAAVDAAQRAPLRAEDPHNALYNLAAFCSLLNDARCVERNLRAAVAAAPAWYKPHWMLARTLEAAGRVEEAKSEAKLALDLNSGKDSEVKETLQAILAREK